MHRQHFSLRTRERLIPTPGEPEEQLRDRKGSSPADKTMSGKNGVSCVERERVKKASIGLDVHGGRAAWVPRETRASTVVCCVLAWSVVDKVLCLYAAVGLYTVGDVIYGSALAQKKIVLGTVFLVN